MNDTLRRTWPAVLIAVLAVCYLWIGAAEHGWDRVLGLVGGAVILTAVVVARRSVPAAFALLIVGVLPLAIVTWWSIVTPLIAILTLLLGGVARQVHRPGPVAEHGITSSDVRTVAEGRGRTPSTRPSH